MAALLSNFWPRENIQNTTRSVEICDPVKTWRKGRRTDSTYTCRKRLVAPMIQVSRRYVSCDTSTLLSPSFLEMMGIIGQVKGHGSLYNWSYSAITAAENRVFRCRCSSLDSIGAIYVDCIHSTTNSFVFE